MKDNYELIKQYENMFSQKDIRGNYRIFEIGQNLQAYMKKIEVKK